jgi:tetratricopeptide (TPR) repeat protein
MARRAQRSFPACALAVFLILSAACKRTPEQLYQQALRDMEAKNFERAQLNLRQVIRQQPENVEAYYHFARCALQLKDGTGAYNALRTAEKLDKQSKVSAEIRLELARLFLAAHEYEEARRRAQWVLSRDRNHKVARGLLAAAFAGLAQPNAAAQELDQIMTEDPQSLQARILRASIHMVAKEVTEAQSVLEEAVALSSRSNDSLLALANFHQLIGQPGKAAALYREVVQRDPKNLQARAGEAWLLARSGDRPKAEQAFRELAQMAPDDLTAVTALATYYFMVREWNLAIAELERVGKELRHLPTRELLASAYYMGGRREDARRVVNELLAQNNQNVRARMLKGLIHLGQEQYDDASAEFTHVLHFRADMAQANYLLALANFASGKEQGALQQMENALKADPALLAARVWLVEYHLRNDAPDAGLNLLREAPAAQQYASEVAVLRALCAPGGKPALADQQALRSALITRPALIVGYYQRGLGRYFRSQAGAIRQILEAVLKAQPASLPALAVVVATLEDEGHLEAALQRVQKQLSLAGNSFSHLLMQAQLEIKLQRYAAARATLLRAAQLQPESLDVVLGLAEVETATGNLEMARQHYDTLVKRKPDSSEAWTRLAIFQESQGAFEEARRGYEKALVLNRRNAVAANNLGWLLAVEMHDLPGALTYAQRARDLDGANPAFADTLGWVHHLMGTTNSALPLLEEAVRRQPQSASYRFHLGVVQEKAGRKREALENLEAALRLDPRFPQAGEAQRRISDLRRR